MESKIREAAEQLEGSAAGLDAIRWLLRWFEGSGLKLDQHNKQAVMTLIQCAWGGMAGTTLQAMYEVETRHLPRTPERTDWDRDDPDIHGH